MEIKIERDDLSDGKIDGLLNAHLKEMQAYSPPESIHALDPEMLRDPSIVFWSARAGSDIAGCGALKAISSVSGEIKSMKTSPDFLRKGIGAGILEKIIEEAQKRSYSSINLETGSDAAFEPAIKMYIKYGFEECGPYGSYVLDPYSKFYTLNLKKSA